MSSISKGLKTPLLHTLKARQRILVAISWDSRAAKVTLADRLRGTDQQHDLDLCCFVFDKNGGYIDFVGSMAQDSMDQTGAIYHSGDDATGEGGGDDETISCELANLPLAEQIIFVTEIRSDHTFADIANPAMRIADGMTNKNLLEAQMGVGAPEGSKACIMAKIFRTPESPTGWSVELIDQYSDLSDVSDWAKFVTKYL